MTHVVPPPTEVPRPPLQIVMAIYLRGLREAKGVRLVDAACATGVTLSTVSRWERAESPISPEMLRSLLLHYGVAGRRADYLARNLPPQSYTRRERDEKESARRAPYDYWADVEGPEAAARYLAVMRLASSIVEYCMLVPAGLRTSAYRTAVLDPTVCTDPDEPVLGLPSWVHRIERTALQQRTVLLDETVLARPRGGPETMAGQLRHLADLVSSEAPEGRGLTIRILPMGRALSVHTASSPAEVTLYGCRMVTRVGLFPSYETGSAARTVSAGLREAVSAACSREETYELLVKSAQAMERRIAP
ncbi:Scr1 family TA system antitoxin-like transcriptional regulator [Streptomyces sp. NPDC002746]